MKSFAGISGLVLLAVVALGLGRPEAALGGAARSWAPDTKLDLRTGAPQTWAMHTYANILFFVEPRSRPSFFAEPRRPADFRRARYPGLLSRSAKEYHTIHTIFPQDGALIPTYGRVTFGWLPMDDEEFKHYPASVPFTPRIYELIIVHEDRSYYTRTFFVQENLHQYTALFQPPTPGRYRWWVRALTDSRLTDLHSEPRYFMVLPE